MTLWLDRRAAARALVALQLCSLAGCYDASPLRRAPDGRRPDAGSARESADAAPARGTSEPGSSAWHPEPRWVFAGEVENARDLGGVPVRDGAVLRYGRLFRGPPLAPLTAAGCSEFARSDIRTVIDLRIASERDAVPEANCIATGSDVVAAPLPVPYNVSPTDYVAILDAADSVVAVFDKLGNPRSYPIYFHCTWGRDRTGVLAAIVLRALGASRADILKEYMLSAPVVGAYPQSLEAALDAIERRGGIDAYLEAAGVSRPQLSAMRDSLLGAPGDPN